ncbi:MAG TPA: biotin/lipoyl-containing protein [Candidatus Limnocylindrales bacterium]|nr:biotin/lipoyl-containing protein [Candidatus Limnocylindrales bacterium]
MSAAPGDPLDPGDPGLAATDPAAIRVTVTAAAGRPEVPALVIDGRATDVTVTGPDERGRAVVTAGGGSGGEGAGEPGGERRAVLFLDPSPRPGGSADGIIRREVVVGGWRVEVEIEGNRRAALRERATRAREAVAHGGPTEVRAIIPGRVLSVSVVAGDDVVAGQQILAIEAMKMQNELRAPRDGRITRVAVAADQTIEVGDLLVVIE